MTNIIIICFSFLLLTYALVFLSTHLKEQKEAQNYQTCIQYHLPVECNQWDMESNYFNTKCPKCGNTNVIDPPHECVEEKESWEEEFDRKFEGYWRGQAFPDEIKFFIRSLFRQKAAEIEEMKRRIQSNYSNSWKWINWCSRCRSISSPIITH